MFIAIISRSCNGQAVRIKLSKPWGKIWLKTKTKRKNIYSKEKNSSAEAQTYTICTEGRLLFRPLRHTAKNKVRWKIIIFKILFQWNSTNRRCLKLVELYLSWIQRYIWGTSYNYLLLSLLTFRPPFPPKFFWFVSSERDGSSNDISDISLSLDLSKTLSLRCLP